VVTLQNAESAHRAACAPLLADGFGVAELTESWRLRARPTRSGLKARHPVTPVLAIASGWETVDGFSLEGFRRPEIVGVLALGSISPGCA
jgi:hypothetical protein